MESAGNVPDNDPVPPPQFRHHYVAIVTLPTDSANYANVRTGRRMAAHQLLKEDINRDRNRVKAGWGLYEVDRQEEARPDCNH
jgi:hypothetical protein